MRTKIEFQNMNAIEVNNLTKIYRLYNSPKDRLRELISISGRKFHHEFHALNDVSFLIEKGQTVGIIGKNGSGKSTLLKLICGVLQPSSGSVKVNGRISSLLELGAGFNPEFTGRENVYMNGALTGFNRAAMESRFPDIESFADIGEYIDQPVKSYSSGMYVRLAFAAAINVDPEILIVDEALSVGDMFFQSKCISKMTKMIESGITLLFVTHDIGRAKSLCEKSIWLNQGKLLDYDMSDKVVQKYFSMQVEGEQKIISPRIVEKVALKSGDGLFKGKQEQIFFNNSEFQKRSAFQRIQNGKANFANIQLLDEHENELKLVKYEQNVILRMAIEIFEDIPTLGFGYHIRDKNGVDALYSDSFIEDNSLHSVKGGERYIIDWCFKSSLQHGIYNIACVASIPIAIERGKVEFCDYVPLAVQFQMETRSGAKLCGLVHLDNYLKIHKVRVQDVITKR